MISQLKSAKNAVFVVIEEGFFFSIKPVEAPDSISLSVPNAVGFAQISSFFSLRYDGLIFFFLISTFCQQ